MRRLRAEQQKWQEAGLKHVKGKSLQRELQKLQTREITDHMTAASTTLTQHVTTTADRIDHSLREGLANVSQKLAPLESLMLPSDGETTKEAITRNRLQYECLRALAAGEREQAKKQQEEAKQQAKKQKEEQQATKKQRRT